MKRPLQLSLAIALALGVTDAFALGLGAIQVRSGLNQPLNAEIPVIVGSPGEAEGLLVQLATAEDFERVGMNRSSVGVPLEFSIGKNARGESVIRVTSTEIVREPFLGILIEANWPKGRLLREYTMLLDPPVMAPAVKGSSAIAVAASEPERATTRPLPESKPAPAPAPAPARAAAPAAPAANARAEPATRPEPASAPVAAPRQISGSEYGPVAAGETLGEIARATRPDDNVSVNQMMLALLRNNPDAFFRDNINALKRGAVLRIPTAEEIGAAGSAREAAVAVRSQIDEWRGSAGSTPTLVAETGAITTSTSVAPRASSSGSASGERLALVPPREGMAGEQAADRPTTGTAGGTGDVASKAELARVKEALTSREQEASELKSRVKDLEDLKNKNSQLISLQNSELAELREKLKAMQDAPAVAPAASAPSVTATTPSASPAALPSATPATDPAVAKDDIWGETATSTPPTATSAQADAGSTASGDTPAVEPRVETSPSPATDPSMTTDPLSSTGDPATITDPTVLDPAMTPDSPAPIASTDVAPMVAPEPVAPAPIVEPVGATPSQPESPWYMQPWALGAAGLGGLLLLLLGVAGMRKRKTAEVDSARPSIAESFGDAPLAESYAGSSLIDPEEEQLIDQVRADPGNAGAHLELLSLYYAQRDGGKFEAAAEEMYAYVADPNQAEWREARSMGEDLVPHNPLFGGSSNLSDMAGDDVAMDDEAVYRFDEDVLSASGNDAPRYDFDAPAPPQPATNPYATTTMPAVDFDFDADKRAEASTSESAFGFDLPPIDPVEEPRIVTEYDIEPEPEPPASSIDDDEFFAGDDAIGTKLDLAKAYLDMGDPDGARAMLEEVLAEGSAAQQDEARKLIAEIR